MYLTEQHIIKQKDPRFKEIDAAAFASKNLYNAANYLIRQEFILNKKYLSYYQLNPRMQNTPEYRALPAKVSAQVLLNLDRNWKAFFRALASYKKEPGKFFARPRIPRYKDKIEGRNLLTYIEQAISKRYLKQGFIKPSKLDILVKTRQAYVKCVRIVPRSIYYAVEVIYEVAEKEPDAGNSSFAAIDIGLDNLATVTSDQQGFTPLLVNGRPLKSLNQFYNKKKAMLQSRLKRGTSWRIKKLTFKRDCKLKHELHVASRRIINLLIEKNIGTLVIGISPDWKQSISLGKRTNQNFVSIPHARFVSMLTYKAKLAGIKVRLVKENYTSKCSFLDMEPVEKRESYVGKRITRGLFRSGTGRLINADVNAAYNILRKAAPNAFSNGVEGVAVHPVRLSLTN